NLTTWVFDEYRSPFVLEERLNTILSIYVISVVLIILFTMVIMKKNIILPLRNIVDKVKRNECALPTGIREVDSLIETINDAIATAELKGFQMSVLHNIAVAINRGLTLDETMEIILEQSKRLINAELSAIAVYDEKGRFKKLKFSGVSSDLLARIRKMPEGKGILQLMKLSLKPVRINDITKHEAFSGSFPEGHPEIRSFLGYPIFSSTGKPLGALYFANKLNGEFTEEDEELLTAIASDSAVAIQRAQETEELEEFKNILDNAYDVVVITDLEGNILYVNRSFEQLTGYTKDEAIGQNPRLLKSGMHDESFYKELWDTILSGRPWKGEFINRKKDGSFYITSATIFPLFDEKGEISHFVSVQRDVTEEKKLYEQLLRAQKMEAIGTLAGGIAHDFNNILTAVLGYAEILKDALGEENERLTKAVRVIENSAKKGAELANKILNITRKEKLELKVVDLNSIVRDAVELINRSIPKEIEVRVSLAEELPPVKADPSQLHQVIMNLAINARDAMPDGGVLTIKTEKVGRENGASNGVKGENGFVRLEVSDTGMGIDKDMQSKIFDPFFTTKEKGRGTGLGLYIVHSIITNHGGYINVYSEPKKGTRFSVYLPVSKEKPSEEKELKEEDLRGNNTILVVDDEQEIRELVVDLLEPLGYRIIQASDGNEAIERFRQMKDEIDLVVLDMIMPRMSGTEVFQRLKNIDENVKIIIASGYSNDGISG
ncbi:MAG: hybrid sensor histidine kinase/response regulator, partial [Nitrospirae bacterium]